MKALWNFLSDPEQVLLSMIWLMTGGTVALFLYEGSDQAIAVIVVVLILAATATYEFWQ